MSNPWVPPYFGSYEQLVKELLHNPFLGSGSGGPIGPPHHLPELAFGSVSGSANALNPQPLPPGRDPSRSAVISYLSSLVGLHELAKSIQNPALSGQFAALAESGIEAFLDDYCGTPPRRIPWPWPGPGPWVVGLVSELVQVANQSATGAYREGLMQIAARVAEKAFGGAALAQAGGL